MALALLRLAARLVNLALQVKRVAPESHEASRLASQFRLFGWPARRPCLSRARILGPATNLASPTADKTAMPKAGRFHLC